MSKYEQEKKWIETAVHMAKIIQASKGSGMSTEPHRWGHLISHLESDGHYADLDSYPAEIKEIVLGVLDIEEIQEDRS